MPTLTRLETIIVDKPWGRTDIPRDFGDFGDRRVGEIWFAHPGGTDAPIMVKFLFTSERLSIQVHPGDDDAQAAGYPRGKEECWLVLDAEPDAELGVGLVAPTTRELLHDAALDGSIVDMIDWRAAKPDDFVYNRAGTIHAIGAGLTVVEVQQNVDCTYRLYDYGRPRKLHLDAGLAVSETAPRPDHRDGRVAATANRLLVDGPHFRLLHLSGPEAATFLPREAADFTFTPLSRGCSIAGEAVKLGECVATDRADAIALASGARALLCWPA
ncbi:class I mannose-6-phosphate isomerase [Sphingopyxis sp. SE2]|uniref:class I mannose-6-phosphate isomerase n=1 Tax=unclassified Sphingopyxis TaxID=2614943 RepID=UPI00050E412E|nr:MULTISPECIES: class I mannose-6-phosphate isomerase [unclassified Sphingopyxis]KGB53687.1 Phosphomannose isomerase-like protein [Sphingopyxis sp. LC363]MDT7527868.1 class I mannose-6-phosphate isomerase [Sphingopyxis sp. SE2]